MMDFETFANTTISQTQMIINELTKTRPQEIVIIGMLAIAIGIGIAILVQLKKLKDRL